MELRSRSNTPLFKQSAEREIVVTRRSQRIEANVETKKRSQKKRVIVTSDYSSEEGETADNTKNLIKEELAHSSTINNGNGEVSALKLYREAGEYWNKYPKTDYTYSRHSKDRVELASGVVIMPNMSRKSLRSTFIENSICHKETNTEKFNDGDTTFNRSVERIMPQVLFTDNNKNDYYTNIKYGKIITILRKIFIHIFNFLQIILSPLYFIYEKQQSIFLYMGKIVHRTASRIMLWDTWILQKNVPSDRKLYSIFSLCLLPLLALGGLWFLYAILAGLSSWMSTLTINRQEVSPEPKINFKSEISFKPEPDLKSEKLQNKENYFGFDEEKFKKELELKLKIKFDELQKQTQKQTDDDFKIKVVKFMEEMELFKKSLKATLTEEVATKVLNTIPTLSCNEIDNKIVELQEANLMFREDLARLNLQNMYFNRIFLQVKNSCKKPLNEMLILMGEFEKKIGDLNGMIANNIQVIANEVYGKLNTDIKSRGVNIDDDHIKKIVSETLSIYDADKTGLVDYAMESAGGHIISTRCTQIYQPKTAVISIFGIPIWYPSNTPRTVITPGTNPGQCWAFQNFPGFLVIKLYGFVKITSFSMEHVSTKLAPNEKISSAPKDFEVYGLKDENDLEAVLLGTYRYLSDGGSLQFFPVQSEVNEFELVELKVLSNHGNPNYTCLYRFRVHGELIGV